MNAMQLNNHHTDPQYTEIWPRLVIFDMLPQFQPCGFDKDGNWWQHSLCIIDDFGNALPADLFPYTQDELRSYLAPDVVDVLNPPPDFTAEKYPYILHTPMPH